MHMCLSFDFFTDSIYNTALYGVDVDMDMDTPYSIFILDTAWHVSLCFCWSIYLMMFSLNASICRFHYQSFLWWLHHSLLPLKLATSTFSIYIHTRCHLPSLVQKVQERPLSAIPFIAMPCPPWAERLMSSLMMMSRSASVSVLSLPGKRRLLTVLGIW